MAKKIIFTGVLVIALVFGMMVVGCDNGSTGGGDPKTVTYQSTDTAGSTTYILIITVNGSTTTSGDSYVLTIKKTGQSDKVSKGAVSAVDPDGTLTLQPKNSDSESFDVTISDGKMTAITGTIAIEGDGEPVSSPGTLTPQENGNEPGEQKPGKPDATFTSIDDMDAWLRDKPYNTANKPYIIALNVDTVGGRPSSGGSIGSILKRYDSLTNPQYSKYVYLDLSGSTFTDVNVEAFSSLSNLTGIILPNTVTIIRDMAFSYCDNLSSVTIPDGVTTIGGSNTNVNGGVFSHCTSLVSITIPSSVTSIGGYDQFGYCTSLTAINVDPANTAFSSVGGVLYNKDQTILRSYPAGKTAASFTIPNGITTIWAYAFSGCTSLTSVTIPDSVTGIMNSAFADCTSITSVTIPDSVTGIGSNLFYNCTSLTTINVDDANTAFSSVDGIVYNKNKTTLFAYPPGKTAASFTIPDTVAQIAEYSFYCCNNLTSVTIPSSVTSIRMGAFLYCRNLTSVTFQGAITSGNFSSSAFTGDLSTKYVGIGTYTTTAPVTPGSTVVWTKQS